jgi:glucuronosyltransferase
MSYHATHVRSCADDLPGHKNIKLFITHGGLLSTQEATYHGVPVVGVPIGADQMLNMKKTEIEGAGLTLEWANLSADKIYDAIKRVITEPRYIYFLSTSTFIYLFIICYYL